MDYRQLAYQKALKYGLDPDLFLRQINQESGFNPKAVSSAGAIGLGQLMPNTARELGVDPTDPDQNLEGAARYMRQQMDRFGRTDLALAAYNAGPTRVAKANAIPNIAETQNYVSSILGSSPRISTKGSNMPMNKQQEEQGFDTKGALLSLASGLNALILPTARDQNAAGQLAEYQKQKEQLRSANKTAAYFESIGRNDLAQLVRDRAISGRDAFSTYTQEQAAARSLEAQQAASDLAYKRELEKMGISEEYAQKREERGFGYNVKLTELKEKLGDDKTTALIRNAKAAGLVEGTPEFSQYVLSGGDIYSKEVALLSNLSKPPEGQYYDFQRDASGNITGFSLKNIKGGPAEAEAQKVAKAEESRGQDLIQKDFTFFGAGERIIDAIDNDPTIIPKTGIIAGMIADTPFGQKQKNVAEDLAIMESQMQFETLAELKRASPSGASGLGQLTDSERKALGKVKQNFNNLQSEDAIKRTIRSSSLLRTYMKNGIKDKRTGEYRNATDSELEMMVQGINPFGPDSGVAIEGLPSGIFPSGQNAPKRLKFDSQGNVVE